MPTKPIYRKMQIEDLNPEKDNEVWSAKIDGAHTVIKMKAGKTPELFSHRVSKKTDKQIPYTSKLPHIERKSLYDAEVRGETYAIDDRGRAVHPDVVTSFLNSGVKKSLDMQKALGIKTATALIDVDSFNGKDMRNAPYKEKREVLDLIARTNPDFHLPDTAFDVESKKRILNDILKKEHPQTKEGIVVHDLNKPNKPFTKAKVIDHHDVYITGIFNESGVKKERKPMAGGFTYAWTPNGKTVGKVGTGFDHEMKTDMYHNPDKYIGRAAKVKALDVSKNKVLVKPSFDGWHVEKNLGGVEKMSLGFEERLLKEAGLREVGAKIKDNYYRTGVAYENLSKHIDEMAKHHLLHPLSKRYFAKSHTALQNKDFKKSQDYYHKGIKLAGLGHQGDAINKINNIYSALAEPITMAKAAIINLNL